MELLPSGYTYDKKRDAYGADLLFIREIKDEQSAQKWFQEWSDLTKVTWRKRRTYPRSGRHNCYKVDMKCQHAADSKGKGVHTKKTGCTATIQIKVSCNKEEEWPTTVAMKGSHNHPLENPSVLKYRDMGSETKEKLLALFHQGHIPSSALNCLKTDLLLQHENDYDKFACDGKYVPTLSRVRHFYYNEFMDQNQEQTQEINSCKTGEEISKKKSPKLTENEKEALQNIFKRIYEGLVKEPENFVPAVRQMMCNINSLKSNSDFLSALHNFGKYRGFQSVECSNKLLTRRKRSHSKTTGVQPKAIRQKLNGSGPTIIKVVSQNHRKFSNKSP